MTLAFDFFAFMSAFTPKNATGKSTDVISLVAFKQTETPVYDYSIGRHKHYRQNKQNPTFLKY